MECNMLVGTRMTLNPKHRLRSLRYNLLDQTGDVDKVIAYDAHDMMITFEWMSCTHASSLPSDHT